VIILQATRHICLIFLKAMCVSIKSKIQVKIRAIVSYIFLLFWNRRLYNYTRVCSSSSRGISGNSLYFCENPTILSTMMSTNATPCVLIIYSLQASADRTSDLYRIEPIISPVDTTKQLLTRHNCRQRLSLGDCIL
jgi:hypothetical protein